VPDILRDQALMLLTNSENKLHWLEKLFQKTPNLFKAILIDSDLHAMQLFLIASYLPDSRAFDFLISHGVNLCLAFDEVARKSMSPLWYKNDSSWLGARYKEYLKKCEK
jgi:hypothetical protein